MILYTTPHVSIGYEADTNLIWSCWTGEVPSAEFRKSIELSIEVAEVHKPPFWLSNNKNATILAPQDQAWVNDYFMPKLAELGCRKMAIIMPDEFYNQMTLDDLIMKGEAFISYEIQFFSDEVSAREWLTENAAEPALVPVKNRSDQHKKMN